MSSSPTVECHRFFAISKRVPKDVKRFCGICRQHGKLAETRGHVCEFKDCECPKCELVRSRRLVMSQQIRLRRAQDKRFQRTTEPEEADVVPLVSTTASSTTTASGGGNREEGAIATTPGAMETEQQLLEARNMCYFCQKCKNHGILVWKKHHKRQCPFTDCTCDFCELIETRRRLDQHIKRRKSAPQGNNGGSGDGDEGDHAIDEDDEGDGPPRKKSTSSLPAQIEAMAYSSSSGSALGSPTTSESIGEQIFRLEAPNGSGSPLDALTAQLSRIHQQREPSPISDQAPPIHLSSPSSTPTLTDTNSTVFTQQGQVPTTTATTTSTLDPLQQLLQQSQSLLSPSCCSSISASSTASPSGAMLPLLPPLLGEFLPYVPPPMPSSALFPLPTTTMPPGLLHPLQVFYPMLAQSSSSFIQQQQQPNGVFELASLLGDPLLAQLLFSGTTTSLAANTLPLPSVTREGQQRELLLQIIAKLLQEQQQGEQMLMLQQQLLQTQPPTDGGQCPQGESSLLAALLMQQQNQNNMPGELFPKDPLSDGTAPLVNSTGETTARTTPPGTSNASETSLASSNRRHPPSAFTALQTNEFRQLL